MLWVGCWSYGDDGWAVGIVDLDANLLLKA